MDIGAVCMSDEEDAIEDDGEDGEGESGCVAIARYMSSVHCAIGYRSRRLPGPYSTYLMGREGEGTYP